MPVGCIVYRRRSPSGRVNSRNGSLTQGGEVYCFEVEARHVFQPIAMETLGVFNSSARQFIRSLGHRISSISGEARETLFSLPENNNNNMISVIPPFWVHHCFTALSWTNRGMVAVVIWPEQQRGFVTLDARMR